MDPLTALSLAGTVVQFVDFGSKLLKESRDLYRSATGTLAVNEELELTTNDLRALIDKVRNDLSTTQVLGPWTEDETVEHYSFERICDEAAKVAETIIERLDKLKVKGTKHRKWESFHQAIKSAWTREELTGLVNQLSSFKEALQSRVLFSIRESLDADSVRTSARFDCLDEQTQRIITTMLDTTRIITDNVSNNVREQISLFKQTLPQLLSRLELGADGQLREHRAVETRPIPRAVGGHQDITANIEMLPVPYDIEFRLRQSTALSVVNALWYPSMTDRYEDVVDAYSETFGWIFSNSLDASLPWADFPGWLTIGSGVYWISGKAGSGKSTLMKHIFDDNRTRDSLAHWAAETPLCIASFFFWSSGTNEQKSQSGLIRALLHRVLSQYPDLVPVVLPEEWALHYSASISHAKFLTKWSIRQLTKAFKALVEQDLIPLKMCFLIDGLDEFEGDQEALEALAILFKDIASSHVSNVKVCISSRPWLIFEDLFSSSPHLRLHDLTNHDIERFVTGKLNENTAFQRLADKEPAKASGLITEIVSTARGVFLWVRLVVRSLLVGIRNRDSIAILRSRLRLLPKELEPLYSHLLDLIDPVYLVWTSKAFQIVRLSREYEDCPFGVSNRMGKGPGYPSIAEFYIAITDKVFFHPLQGITLKNLDGLCKETEIHLTARCAGLLEVQSSRGNPFDRRVQYLHRTVDDFLRRDAYWPNILARTASTEFDPNVSMLKASIFALFMKSRPMGNIFSEGLGLSELREHVLVTMTFAYHADGNIETQEFQTRLLDFVEGTMCHRKTSLYDGTTYWPNTLLTYDRQIDNFLGFATLFDLRRYVSGKLLKYPGGSLRGIASPLLHLLLIDWHSQGKTVFPLPSPEMVSILIRFRADPHWRNRGSSTWENVLSFIERTSDDTKSHKLETLAYLRIMKVLVTSVAATRALTDAWVTLAHAPLHVYPDETKDVLRELKLKIPPADLDKLPSGLGDYRGSFQGAQIEKMDRPGQISPSDISFNRYLEDITTADEQGVNTTRTLFSMVVDGYLGFKFKPGWLSFKSGTVGEQNE